MAPRLEIKCPKLLLVEGADAYYFSIWACQAFGVGDVQVMDFGGIAELTAYLKTLSMVAAYEQVSTIVVARDAETNSESAVKSVQNSFKQTSLPIPEKPFEYAGDTIRTAFMIFPGVVGQDLTNGTLEDLCLDIVKDCSTFDCVDAYIQCLQSSGYEIKRPHKTKLHSFLSGKDDFVGMKIGEAAKAGAWDWEHARLQQFKDIITKM